MNGFLVGDAVTGAALLSVALRPAMGISGFMNSECNEKVSAGATAAFVFAFLHRAGEASEPHSSVASYRPSIPDGEDPATFKWWKDVDLKAVPSDFFVSATTAAAKLEKRKSVLALTTRLASQKSVKIATNNLQPLTISSFPPNASPIPHFTQTNEDGTEVQMYFYLHPSFPLFCVAVDTIPQSATSSYSTTAIGPFVAAAMANYFLRHHGPVFLKSLQLNSPIKSSDLKLIKKQILPHMKSVYQTAVGGLIGDSFGRKLNCGISKISSSGLAVEIVVESEGDVAVKPPGTPQVVRKIPDNELSKDIGGMPSRVSLLTSSLLLVSLEPPSNLNGAVRATTESKREKVESEGKNKNVNPAASPTEPESPANKIIPGVYGVYFLSPFLSQSTSSSSSMLNPDSFDLISMSLSTGSSRWASLEARRMRQSALVAARLSERSGFKYNLSAPKSICSHQTDTVGAYGGDVGIPAQKMGLINTSVSYAGLFSHKQNTDGSGEQHTVRAHRFASAVSFSSHFTVSVRLTFKISGNVSFSNAAMQLVNQICDVAHNAVLELGPLWLPAVQTLFENEIPLM